MNLVPTSPRYFRSSPPPMKFSILAAACPKLR